MDPINEMGSFWSGWIILLTVVSLAGLLWLLLTVFLDKRRDELDMNWDETLREASNPPPWWWFSLLLVAMIFSLIYLILYPGLGQFRGTLGWTQDGQLHDSILADQTRHQAIRNTWYNTTIDELALDNRAMLEAGRIFNRQCTSCHGLGGYGQKGFPNLRDNDWQWGDSVDHIKSTLEQGRKAQMPAWSTALNEQQIREVTDYLLALARAEDKFVDYLAEQAVKYSNSIAWPVIMLMGVVIRHWAPLILLIIYGFMVATALALQTAFAKVVLVRCRLRLHALNHTISIY